MNTARMAAALNTASMALAELAEALTENGVRPATAAVSAPPTAIDDDFPPFEPQQPVYEALPLASDAPGLGRCPNHGTAWSVKNAGVSKAGKAYESFWKCDGKNPDGTWCDKKPTRGWADAHPIRTAVPA